jgi:MFS family permease
VLLGGLVSDALCRRFGPRPGRRAPALMGLPVAAAAVIGAVTTPAPMLAAALFALAAAAAAFGVAPGWAVCVEVGGQHTGVVTGAMNMFGNLGGAISPVVVGLCLEHLGSWHAPLYTVAFFYVVTAACWLGIDATQPVAHKVKVS